MSFMDKPPEKNDPPAEMRIGPAQTPAAEKPAEVKKTPVKIPGTRLLYRGKIFELLGIHIINLLLSIITLGIYSFWGKTRIRRYMTSHIILNKDRFEYTGTGMELFTGWLKALLIFLPVIVAMQIPFVNFIALPVFFGIISVAIFLAMRYRLSRTRWRGIRFSLVGSAKEYMFLAIKRTLINIFTLGFKIPKSDIMKWSYIAGNMKYGDLQFKYAGDHKSLFKTHVTTILISILVPAMIGGAIKGQEMIAKAEQHAQMRMQQQTPGSKLVPEPLYAAPQYEQSGKVPQPTAGNLQEESKGVKKILPFILLSYLGFFSAFVVRLWYHAALWREKFRTLSLNGIRFKANITGGGLFKLYAGNILIIVCTLGLGKPIALHRTLSFFTRNVMIGGNLDELKAMQDKNAKPTGMGDALAADVGFDLGL